jgi:hypothetical protein
MDNEQNHLYYKLKLYSLHGTPSHFYHFFYGVLIPLIKFYDELEKQTDNKITILIDDEIGPMIRILYNLPIDIKYKYNVDKNIKVIEEYLLPMDIHPNKDPKDIRMVNKKYAMYFTYDIKKQVNKWMSNCLEKYDLILKPKYKIDIVIIQRTVDKKFKSMVFSKDNQYADIFKKSGSERRNITNHNELVELIKKKYSGHKVLNVSLENLSLFDQFYLFKKANIIIAQHGASLANICWMKKKSLCIEIVSNLILGLKENWFGFTSNICKVNHIQFETKTSNTSLLQVDDTVLNIEKFEHFLDDNDDIIKKSIEKHVR